MQCSGLKCTQRIATKFCTCHDSYTVVMCAKFRCDRLSIFFELEHSKFWLNFEFGRNSVSGTGARFMLEPVVFSEVSNNTMTECHSWAIFMWNVSPLVSPNTVDQIWLVLTNFILYFDTFYLGIYPATNELIHFHKNLWSSWDSLDINVCYKGTGRSAATILNITSPTLHQCLITKQNYWHGYKNMQVLFKV